MDDFKPPLRDELGLRGRRSISSSRAPISDSMAIESRLPEIAHVLRIDLQALPGKSGTVQSNAVHRSPSKRATPPEPVKTVA
jgi:hypothetical protein